MTTQIEFTEQDLKELVTLLREVKRFSVAVTEQYKFDGSQDHGVAIRAWENSGHFYQSSCVLLDLFKGLVEDDQYGN